MIPPHLHKKFPRPPRKIPPRRAPPKDNSLTTKLPPNNIPRQVEGKFHASFSLILSNLANWIQMLKTMVSTIKTFLNIEVGLYRGFSIPEDKNLEDFEQKSWNFFLIFL